jgi:hypothetical protein
MQESPTGRQTGTVRCQMSAGTVSSLPVCHDNTKLLYMTNPSFLHITATEDHGNAVLI